MRANLGKMDRVLRICLGLAVVGAGIAFQSWWGLLGIVPLAAVISGYCPACSLMGTLTGGKSAEGGACCAKDGAKT